MSCAPGSTPKSPRGKNYEAEENLLLPHQLVASRQRPDAQPLPAYLCKELADMIARLLQWHYWWRARRHQRWLRSRHVLFIPGSKGPDPRCQRNSTECAGKV